MPLLFSEGTGSWTRGMTGWMPHLSTWKDTGEITLEKISRHMEDKEDNRRRHQGEVMMAKLRTF